MKILDQIKFIDENICENIDKNSILNDRGFLSQNILSQLRNLVEHCSMYINLRLNGLDDNISLEEAKEKIPSIPNKIGDMNNEFRFIKKFHNLLQVSESHYAHDKNNSERLMLKYYEYMLRLKKLCIKTLDLKILSNLHKFPLELDKNLDEYYEKILSKLNQIGDFRLKNQEVIKNRYYVWKVKPIFIKEEMFYEITLTNATDNVSKFSRIVAFSKVLINDNYAIKAVLDKTNIFIQNKSMPIFIISEMETSIRPCEFDNFARIFGERQKFGLTTEVERINEYMTKNNYNLVDIINFSSANYEVFIQEIKARNIQIHFLEVLDKCRKICLSNKSGSNILKYLLYKMNNKIIKDQILKPKVGYEYGPNDKLSNLYLEYKSIPFDRTPFVSSLCWHNPKISDLFECVEHKNREHEFLARFIIQNTQSNGMLYTGKEELSHFSDLQNLINKFNNLLYRTHNDRKICEWKGKYYIQSYEKDVISILKKLKKLSQQGSDKYEEFANTWLENNVNWIDDKNKIEIIKRLFVKTKVAFIYGAAGTGKSTLADYIANLYQGKTQIFLAQTNPAVENIKSKVQNANFRNTYTIAKIVNSKQDFECDLLFIDECSTVSNADMVKILEKVQFKRLILIGDIYQIEAIRYGTWFDIAKDFLPKHCLFELVKPYRTNNDELLKFWESVRNFKDGDNAITEFGVWGKYFLNLDEKNDEIFKKEYDDEIVLCLNYDGLYGVNNINKFLQIVNKNQSFEIGNFEFKIGDPVLFVDNNFFVSDLHNNLKGKIINIIDKNEENELYFKVEVDKVFEDDHVFTAGLELISKNDNKSIVGFGVDKNINTDNDDASEKIPFMLAYAVSIHKSQGLEYDSVKIVITREIEENISHNIFYTAITRAKKYLKIYWSPETQQYIIKNFNIKNNKKDIKILKAKNNI
ncbi:ATP-dependent RecD-like DNA helicase [Campylobacter concisus]|uniref:ATP-dependent DNA helicase n=5 Tax=Campylobacter concisus TaxID=199 RepID=UPI00122CDCB8|nr:ATP-dependent RecD-like DNA helicase [Campylobacter concisus]